MLLTLIHNAALLLAMMVVFDLVAGEKPSHGRGWRQALAGVMLGGLCIGLMSTALRLETGVIFDTRSVLLSLSGLFLGVIPTLFAMAMAAAFRFWQGGAGAWTGIAVILATGGIGMVWRHFRQNRMSHISLRELYGFGVVVHLVMLALMLTLPWETAQRVLAGISLPVLLVYPIASVALGTLLANRSRREGTGAALAESEVRYRTLFENMNAGFVLFEVVQDEQGAPVDLVILSTNKILPMTLGLKPEEIIGKRLTQVLPGIEHDAADWIGIYGQIALTGIPRQFEQGSERLGYHYTVSAFRAGPGQCAVTYIDITGRKAAEAEQQRLFEQQERNRRALLSTLEDKQRSEAALREQETFFRLTAENIGDFIAVLDLEGRRLYNSPSYQRFFGDGRELRGSDSFKEIHPEDRESIQMLFQETVRTGIGREAHYRLITPDGVIHYMESRGSVIADDAGRPLRVVVVSRDVTERRLAEQERQRLASMLESTSDIVSMADPQGNLIYLNGPGRALMGIAPDGAMPEVIPKVHPRWAADLILGQGVPAAIRDGVWSGETAVLGPDGQEIPVSQVILSHKDAQGQLLFLSTIMRDIRPLLAAEQAVRDSEQRLRLALTAANQGLYDLDLTTGEAQVSPEYASMLGYDPATFKETNAAWRERMHPDDVAIVYQAYEDYVAGRQPEYRVEFRQRTRDGGWKWLLSLGRIQEWSDDGRPLRMLGTHTDIDAIKAAEAALRELNASLEARVAQRTAELQALNQSLESFVYSVSHDLKTPLRGIEGYSRLLEEDYANRLDDEGRLFIGNIRGGVARMGELIDDLLAYSRMERKSLACTVINPEPLVRQWLAERAKTLADLAIVTQVELPGGSVLADPDGLAMVLRNLLENALKFSAKAASPHIEIGGRVDQDNVIFWVRDNGIGFDMKYHDRIFEIFQRLHRLEDYPGTGIGLALVKKAMQRMGGRVWAESASGQGATFYFSLPCAEG